MIPIIVCALIGLLLGVKYAPEYDRAFSIMFYAVIAALVGATISAFIGGLLIYNDYDHYKSTGELQNIVDGSNMTGHFFLGSGNIEGVPNYSWYELTGENSYERRDIPAEQGTVHYLDVKGTQPYYVKTWEANHKPFLRTWGFNMNTGISSDSHYDFYIPRGSITNEYKLDAK